MRTILAFSFFLGSVAFAFPPAAGVAGSDAIAGTGANTPFVAWASGFQNLIYGSGVDQTWRTPAKGLGPATTDVYDIVCLGNGGQITMTFPHPIRNGVGADFAIFENAFDDYFLELAFVEVSSDGVNFFRFPTVSLTPSPVGAFGSVYPENLNGFAGKYRGGFGTPFDLESLTDSPLLDKQNVRFVRIIDIIGDGNTKDSLGNKVYDPFPTTGSGGFDLDAVGVIHQNDGAFQIVESKMVGTNFRIEWESNPGSRYRVETSATLGAATWQPVQEIAGAVSSGRTNLTIPLAGDPKRFWRIVRLP